MKDGKQSHFTKALFISTSLSVKADELKQLNDVESHVLLKVTTCFLVGN